MSMTISFVGELWKCSWRLRRSSWQAVQGPSAICSSRTPPRVAFWACRVPSQTSQGLSVTPPAPDVPENFTPLTERGLLDIFGAPAVVTR